MLEKEKTILTVETIDDLRNIQGEDIVVYCKETNSLYNLKNSTLQYFNLFENELTNTVNQTILKNRNRKIIHHITYFLNSASSPISVVFGTLLRRIDGNLQGEQKHFDKKLKLLYWDFEIFGDTLNMPFKLIEGEYKHTFNTYAEMRNALQTFVQAYIGQPYYLRITGYIYEAPDTENFVHNFKIFNQGYKFLFPQYQNNMRSSVFNAYFEGDKGSDEHIDDICVDIIHFMTGHTVSAADAKLLLWNRKTGDRRSFVIPKLLSGSGDVFYQPDNQKRVINTSGGIINPATDTLFSYWTNGDQENSPASQPGDRNGCFVGFNWTNYPTGTIADLTWEIFGEQKRAREYWEKYKSIVYIRTISDGAGNFAFIVIPFGVDTVSIPNFITAMNDTGELTIGIEFDIPHKRKYIAEAKDFTLTPPDYTFKSSRWGHNALGKAFIPKDFYRYAPHSRLNGNVYFLNTIKFRYVVIHKDTRTIIAKSDWIGIRAKYRALEALFIPKHQ